MSGSSSIMALRARSDRATGSWSGWDRALPGYSIRRRMSRSRRPVRAGTRGGQGTRRRPEEMGFGTGGTPLEWSPSPAQVTRSRWTMAKPKKKAKPEKDEVREERIDMEIVVDAYGEEERAMGWHCY